MGTVVSRWRCFVRPAGKASEEGEPVGASDVVIDALFGTGFHGTPREEAAAIIEQINASSAPVVSVDLPSAVDASTGEVGGPAFALT